MPSNIAEGSARAYKREFIQFLYVALGSLSELETQLYIAKELNFVNNIEYTEEHIITVRKMLLGLIKNLKNKQVDTNV